MCFFCGIKVSSWRQNEFPFLKHLEKNDSCVYATRTVTSLLTNAITSQPHSFQLKLHYQEGNIRPGSQDVSTQTDVDFTVMCKICYIQNSTILLIPCGHVACCIQCVYQIYSCPYCRTDFTNWKRVYVV